MLKRIVNLLFFVLIVSTGLRAEVPTQENVTRLYVATFNRAPDAAGLAYWINDSGLQLEQIAQSFFDQPETQARYPKGTTPRTFIRSVYQNLFNRDPDEGGWDYWTYELKEGHIIRSQFILAVINGALATTGDPNDAAILNNKTRVGLAFSNAGIEDVSFAKSVMAEVDSSIESVNMALEKIEKYLQALHISQIGKLSMEYQSVNDIVYDQDRNLVYLGTAGGTNFFVIDVKIPASPKVIASMELAQGGSIGAFAYNREQSLLYVGIFNQNRLLVLDCSDPAKPVKMSELNVEGEGISGLALSSDASWLFATTERGGFLSFTLKDPYHPKIEKFLPIDGDWLLLMGYREEIEVIFLESITTGSAEKKYYRINLKEPEEPVLENISLEPEYTVSDQILVDSSGEYAYGGYLGANTLSILKRNDTGYEEIKRMKVSGMVYSLIFSPDEETLFAAVKDGDYPDYTNWLVLYDVRDRENPVELGRLPLEQGTDLLHYAFSSDGEWLYVGNDGPNQFLVFQIDNIPKPPLSGWEFPPVDIPGLLAHPPATVVRTIAPDNKIDIIPTDGPKVERPASAIMIEDTEHILVKTDEALDVSEIDQPLFVDGKFKGIVESIEQKVTGQEIHLKDAQHLSDVYKSFDVMFRNEEVVGTLQRSISQGRLKGLYDHLNHEPLHFSLKERSTTTGRSLGSGEPVLRIDIPKGYYIPVEPRSLHCSFGNLECTMSVQGEASQHTDLGNSVTEAGITFSTEGSYIEIGLGSYLRVHYDHNVFSKDVLDFELAQSAYFIIK